MNSIRNKIKVYDASKRKISNDIYDYFKNEPDIMQVKDIVKILHCSKNTIYGLIKEGKLGAIRLGRCILIPKTSLVNMMVNQENYIKIPKENSEISWTLKSFSI